MANLNKDGQIRLIAKHGISSQRVPKRSRLYLEAGKDKVIVNNANSPIKLRIIDSTGSRCLIIEGRLGFQGLALGKRTAPQSPATIQDCALTLKMTPKW